MKKKIRYIALTLALTVSAFLLGKSVPDKENYLDMETGLMLYTSDGSDYYWER